MNYRLIAFAALLLGAISVVSCIDPDQTQEVILEKDKLAIEKYISENPFTSVKEYKEEAEGFYMFWEVANESGASVVRGDTVFVNYTGKLLNKQVFDTSIEQVARDNGIFATNRTYQPLKFRPGFNFAIVGFEFAISLMKEGEKATVIFPSKLGYGSQPSGPVPANSPLIFELDLTRVKKAPQN
ncbi:FKBP-type peptidyl-prolyl cis-trans isomerase FklB [Algoriphagus alkaliphilus]|uniref:Peptidyl-prolyl cis-trans isomerase n=1 Tax=Algoriphagus alkaliphilus TaxID=279824 RepID=A0A1G5ZDP4_9BACT|nr:FKBP-type peptidyl-prolyl cis-trans isomerase [Algoriphagus alkaliphilus]MBA4301212.1 peptidylprolyl isomerase [Cyclobacterium sp.]SDA92722.1 FKBP-type peptidyl-prolyl cis-trans isomerase FklB [Algoriphagus alkaliphilus]